MTTATAEDAKVCRACGDEKPLSAFARNRGGRRERCKRCLAAEARERYQRERDVEWLCRGCHTEEHF